MSDKYAALKEAAAYSILEEGQIWWDEQQLSYDDGVVFHKADMQFIALASPETILELLSGREADKARIAELDSQRRLAFTACNRWADKFREAEQRIAELESRKVTLPENCEHDVIAPVMSFLYEGGYEFDREDYRAVVGRLRGEIETVLRRTLRAAGITLETGE